MPRTSGGIPLGATQKGDRITIDPYTTPHGRRVFLLHELLHVLWEDSGLAKEQGGPFATQTEETILHSLDAHLLWMLRENPELTDFLLEPGN